MTSLSKKVVSTIVTIAIIGGWYIGVASGLPVAIENTLKHGPEFIKSPNVWFAVAAAIALIVALGWIWAQPETQSRRDRVIDYIRSAMSSIDKKIAEHKAMNWNRPIEVSQFVNQTIPLFLATNVGQEERIQFERFIAEARERPPQDPYMEYRAAVIYLDDFIEKRAASLAKGA